jgi:hypothetical protein
MIYVPFATQAIPRRQAVILQMIVTARLVSMIKTSVQDVLLARQWMEIVEIVWTVRQANTSPLPVPHLALLVRQTQTHSKLSHGGFLQQPEKHIIHSDLLSKDKTASLIATARMEQLVR